MALATVDMTAKLHSVGAVPAAPRMPEYPSPTPENQPTARLVRQSLLRAVRILVRLALLCVVAQPWDAASGRPNILLVLSDDHSVPHLGCYGSQNCKRFNITPNLDALAAEGMRFDRAYTTAPQCAPSRISIFAGRSPVGLAVTRFAQPARPEVPFFTDVLRQNGYWTGLDGRHQHLDGKARDAEHVMEALHEFGMSRHGSRFDHFVRGARTKGQDLGKVPETVAAALDKVPAGKPFFLYFGFNQPHRRFGVDYENIDPTKLELPPDWPDLPEVRVDYARYLDEVRDLDTGIGAITQLLKRRGLEQNTMVIFMGDNGEALLRGKGTLFDRGTHVPLLVRWPGVVKPGVQQRRLGKRRGSGPHDSGSRRAQNAGRNDRSELSARVTRPGVFRQEVCLRRAWLACGSHHPDGWPRPLPVDYLGAISLYLQCAPGQKLHPGRYAE